MTREARRAQVLEAALQTFSRDGYHHVSMDDIAERAAVSKPVLYRHFSSKLDLYLATVEHRGAYLARTVSAAIESVDLGSATPAEAHELVRVLVRTYFDFVEAVGEGSPLLVESDTTRDPTLRLRVESAAEGAVQTIADALAEITGTGPADSAMMAYAVTSMARASAANWLRPPEGLDIEDAVTLVAKLVWGGIRQFIPEGASIRS
jgi:AcrR family transcriptional regulator